MSLIVTGGYGSSGVGVALVIDSVLAFADHVELTFSSPPTLSGPALDFAQYSIATTTGFASAPTSISLVGAVLSVYFTVQTGGHSYTVTVPKAGITDAFDNPFAGPYSEAYSAVGSAPTATVGVVDARTLDVIFNKQVKPSDALNPVNYAFDHGLQAQTVQQITSQTFRLTTTKQTDGQAYNLTISNVHDLAGN